MRLFPQRLLRGVAFMSDRPGRDPRHEPAYTVGEAARYLLLPRATVNAWFFGQGGEPGGARRFRSVLQPPESIHRALSFVNLVEGHMLSALRRQHGVSLQRIRSAIDYLGRLFPDSEHPLAEQRISTDGLDVLVDAYERAAGTEVHPEQLLNASTGGQIEMRTLIEAHLRRVEWDANGRAVRLFPFTRWRDLEEPKTIVIDPFVSFGRPVISGTGIPTSVVASRYKAGESIRDLSLDYGRSETEIEEAIRCELAAA
jgi:uncharacterized protein (DUF433 family)